ncbi:MAG: hypothetical protein J6R27_01180, partial [Muribaculaceae bacterium]|nr:hypothetical protein [Muribaculaceae bacterium]
NTNGAFKVKFPGAKDYSLQVLTTECVVDNTIIVGFEVGEDVAAVKYGILTGGIYGFTEDNYQYIAEKGTEASNAVMQIELSAEDPAGRYTVLAAALDADGNYVAGDGTFFYNVIDNPEEWVSHGQGVYGEDIVSSIYKAFDPVVLQAEIQEHKDIPGYFRVVNPYANSFEAYEIESEHAAEDHNHYIFIDATDPENVVIEESVTGFDLGDGMVFLMSLPAYHESYDKPENYGKMTEKDDDTYLISFPVNSVVAGEMYYQKGAMSYANSNGGLFFEIPKAKSGVENVAVDNVKAEYFNLQGVRVAEPSNGIFIRREGSKVSKVMM